MNRRFIAFMPVLLIAGIAAQVILLALVILLYFPCLIWPQLANGPYNWVTRAGVRMVVQSAFGKGRKRQPEKEVVS